MKQRVYRPQSLKYLLFRPLQKNFAHLCSQPYVLLPLWLMEITDCVFVLLSPWREHLHCHCLSQEPWRRCHFYSTAGDSKTQKWCKFCKATQPVSVGTWICSQLGFPAPALLLPCTAHVEASVNHLFKILSSSVAVDQHQAHGCASRIKLFPSLIIGDIPNSSLVAPFLLSSIAKRLPPDHGTWLELVSAL